MTPYSICKPHRLLHTILHGCLRRLSHHAADVRVRFAPSPTGHLHLGGLRTALYNYLFARAHGGSFVLRIEDTDQTRLVPGTTEKMIEMLQWAGLNLDEGPHIGGRFGPYVQSERIQTYWESMQPLLQNGTAYHCFCTQRRLDLLRKEALRCGETPKYDNRCRHLSAEEVEECLKKDMPYVIRFKLEPHTEPWEDLVYGNITYDVASIEGDPILLKTDRFPTYHWANVVDDHNMQITHVLRGMEWQVSTTKHLLLYKALGWRPPKFAHLPLIINKDGSKLSKRQNDIYVERFKESGYYPDAVLNLLTAMGSGFNVRHTSGMTLSELVNHFDISRMNTNSTRLELDRVDEFNRLHLQRRLQDESSRGPIIQQARHLVLEHLTTRKMDPSEQEKVLSDKYMEEVLDWAKDRISVLQDVVGADLEFLWMVPSQDSVRLGLSEPEMAARLQILSRALTDLPDERFTVLDVKAVLKALVEQHQWKFSSCMRWLRVALSGLQKGPPVADMVTLLGRTNTIDRLKYALDIVNTQEAEGLK